MTKPLESHRVGHGFKGLDEYPLVRCPSLRLPFSGPVNVPPCQLGEVLARPPRRRGGARSAYEGALMALLGAKDCTTEIGPYEIIVDFQWNIPMDVQWHFPKDFNLFSSGSSQRIATCPVDALWNCPMDFQLRFRMDVHLCEFRCAIFCHECVASTSSAASAAARDEPRPPPRRQGGGGPKERTGLLLTRIVTA